MSADIYPSIFLRQMEAIVYIYTQLHMYIIVQVYMYVINIV